MKIKNFFKAFFSFVSRPWVGIIFGMLLMIIPACIAGSDVADLEPGFSYGAVYGMGFIICINSYVDGFADVRESSKISPALSDRELSRSWMKSQCLINEKVLSILMDQWSDIPPVADPLEDDPRF